MPQSRNNFYKIATVGFLFLSVIFGSILIKQNQDIRRKAEGGCPSGQSCQITCDANHPNRDPNECKCWGDSAHGNPGDAQNGSCVQAGITPAPPGTSGHMNCGAVPDGAVVYNSDSHCFYTCQNGTYPDSSRTCTGTIPNVAPTGTYLSNNAGLVAGPGQWTSNGTTVTTVNSRTGPFANRTETCQVCTCTSLTNGECRNNCTMMPCSQAQTPSCGQVDLCPIGQPTQCGAAAENRRVGTNCTNNVTTPTNPPLPTNTPTPTRTPSPTPTVRPSNTPTPTPRPTNTPTPAPRSCGSVNCNNLTNPCQNGLVCITANDSSSYCAKPDYVDACRENPGSSACCNPPAPTATPTNPPPQPRACGAIDCGNTYNPCAEGLVCVAANNSKNYCAKPDYIQACKDKPNSTTCCSAPEITSTPAPTKPSGPTPTRIILPVSGVDLPVKGLGIVGGIVTLLGILLIL